MRRHPYARRVRAIRLLARISEAPVSVGDFVAAGYAPIRGFNWFRSRGLDPASYSTVREAHDRGALDVAFCVASDLWTAHESEER